MISPVRGILPAQRPSTATDAYARFGRAAAERERRMSERSVAQESLEWRVSELANGGRTRVRRWTIDAGDGRGERTIHIDAIVE